MYIRETFYPNQGKLLGKDVTKTRTHHDISQTSLKHFLGSSRGPGPTTLRGAPSAREGLRPDIDQDQQPPADPRAHARGSATTPDRNRYRYDSIGGAGNENREKGRASPRGPPSAVNCHVGHALGNPCTVKCQKCEAVFFLIADFLKGTGNK